MEVLLHHSGQQQLKKKLVLWEQVGTDSSLNRLYGSKVHIASIVTIPSSLKGLSQQNRSDFVFLCVHVSTHENVMLWVELTDCTRHRD